MVNIHQNRTLAHSAEQIYQLVADIERYPEFLPWCECVIILRQTPETVDARVVGGFGMLRQSYLCRVFWFPDQTHTRNIKVEYLSGPLADLFTHWQFTPIMDKVTHASQQDYHQNGCLVDFQMNFSFRKPLFTAMMDKLLIRAMESMTEAFVQRANVLYGKI